MGVITGLWLYLLASFVLMLAVKVWARGTGRQCNPLFAWFHLWVGAFWDRGKRRLYLFPVPCIGVVVDMTPAKPGLMVWRDERAGCSIYRLDGQYVIHWWEATEGQHQLNTIRALRAAFPELTLRRAKDLWDNRQHAA